LKKGSDRGFQTIKNISMTVNKGELCAIVGPVGSGKSSLINAVLGEMYLDDGTISRSGSMAYHCQQPWIVNANIKENILLGEREDEARLRDCIAAACLGPDLAILPSGLLTEIGEKGINLSGGQKARVSLARALYSNADVILMDDPLSAVDANVCDHLFHEAIKKYLCGNGKAVVLVTHQVHLLPECDKVVLLNADGTLRAACKYSELTARGIDVQELLGHTSSDDAEAPAGAEGAQLDDAPAETEDGAPAAPNAETSPTRSRAITPSKPRSNTIRNRSGSANLEQDGAAQNGNSAGGKKLEADAETKGDKLVIDEDRETGLIGSDIYWFTIKAGNVFIFMFILIFSAGGKVAQVFSTRLLSQWGEANVISEYFFRAPLPWPEQSDYLTKYLLLGVASLCSILLGRLSSVLHGLNTALNLHTRMVDHVLKAPTSWFDVTPVGR
jgi:ABC-type Mn2+/Zn2+ transport system ATPase subunit